MSELSAERRKLHRELMAREKEIVDPKARAIVKKHRLALLAMDNIEGSGPDFDAAVAAMLSTLSGVTKMPFGGDATFFQVQAYLTTYILGASDDACDDYHAPLDALLAYLSEREAA
jgi:hypothetical protein